MARIAILHPGEMGAAVGAVLARAGHDVGWLARGRSDATRARADEAGLRELPDLSGTDIVFAICPPAAAVDTARAVAGFAGHYVDANAISPHTARQVASVVTAGGATYVDGGLIGPPPGGTRTVRLGLSGRDAGTIAALFDGSPVETSVLDSDDFAASALKMTYAAWTKISQALLLAVEGAAEQLQVAQALRAEWSNSQPHLAEQLASAQRAAAAKGWRWEAEMREIARTFAVAGEPAGFGEAAGAVFARHPRPDDATSPRPVTGR